VWDVRYVMDVLDLWRVRGKLVQKLQMSCEVKCAPGVQDGCWKWILWQRRERCRCSWCSLGAIGDLEAVITPVAFGGPLCFCSSRGRCNIDDRVRRCRAHCMCSLIQATRKVSFVLVCLRQHLSLCFPVSLPLLPAVSQFLAALAALQL